MLPLGRILVACAATFNSLSSCQVSTLPNWSLSPRNVNQSSVFDLTAPSTDLFRHVHLYQDTVYQSFTFDNKNRRLFVAQRPNNTPVEQGDLCITQLDFSGKILGHMWVKGAGHGVAIGAEAVGSDTYMWTEIDVKSNGYGDRIARFMYVNGATIDGGSKGLTKFKPVEGAGNTICTIDPSDDSLVCRYSFGDTKRIGAFPVAEAAANNFKNPLYDFEQPALKGRSNVFQGFAAYGSYFYMLSGTAYEVNGNVVNSEVTSVDVNTGKIRQGPTLTKAGQSLSFREPEGMAVYTTADGEPRLFLGFASGVAGDRRCNIFYKNKLVAA
ncbi:uncharacterized protein TRUGW13939_04804 [Talaromyces rugulosus]|uniref:P68 RBP/TagC-like beta-propeller domain-containing protein n=1 Tax=Talaromyces rugulosus TaxID=121627 RepID=A0A7H8QV52_TALRU|nr:uncharacterized protein TRUGW13939_04804 [Talaromyces rugulosus]QKX57686.1 hypothetical protein TRUGW13939_04804 [Talaromyces rugulosus]